LAHAVRPESFVEINNFYTATIYEKGAEVIGMLKRLVGDENYARALDLYFTRHDGHAATIEDWLKVFEDVTGRDLTQFKRWYSQAGTPRLGVHEAWAAGAEGGTYTLTFTQTNPPTPGQPEKDAKVIPIAVGLLNPNGDEVVPTTVLEMNKPVQSFAFTGLSARPIPSILRGFSAPVVLEREVPQSERAFLLAHDTDPFNRWEAGRALTKDVLARMVTQGAAPSADLLDGMARLAFDDGLDPAFRALALRLPSEDDMAATLHAAGHVPDPARIHSARRALGLALAEKLSPGLAELECACRTEGPFSPAAGPAGRRALRLAALALMTRLDGGAAAKLAFAQASNMTESFGALAILLENGQGEQELAAFGSRWTHDRLVMDKWFAVQVAMAAPDQAAATVARLTEHPAFDMKNPNRFRAVLGALTANHAGFHHDSGAGYTTLADWLIRLDPLNPQTAARMSTAFETWPRYDADRQAMIRAALDRILATPGLSRDLSEMAGRMRGA
jgi:aminopeptidase N